MDYSARCRASLAAILCLLAGLTVSTGCGPAVISDIGQTETPADTAKFGGTLIIQTGSLVQFDPIFVADDNSFHVVSNVYSLLFRRQGSEIIPDLAASWEYTDDKTLVFHLRQGVMWHDDNAVFPTGESREVVAADVVYSIRRAIETEGSTVSSDLLASYESVQALDDYTVELTLKAPNALLFAMGRGLSGVAIVPREAVEQLGEDLARNPIGSGPFKFVEYKPDESLTLKRNDLYWIKPYLDQVVYRVIPDQEAAVIALEAGEVDILATVPDSDFQRLKDDQRFVLYHRGCPSMTQIAFNVTNPLFDEQRFRQAVASCTEVPSVVADLLASRASVRASPAVGSNATTVSLESHPIPRASPRPAQRRQVAPLRKIRIIAHRANAPNRVAPLSSLTAPEMKRNWGMNAPRPAAPSAR